MQNVFAYRLGSFVWILNGMIGPFLSMAIWLKVSNQSALQLGQVQIVTYFFMAIIVNRLTQVWTLSHMGRWIKSGAIANVLVKPYNYVLENLAQQFSYKTSRLFSLIPVIAVVGYFLRDYLFVSLEWWRITLFLLSLLMGFAVIFIFEHALSLLAFWFDEITGIESVHDLLRQLFGGTLIPFVFMPGFLKDIMTFYPTRFIASFPLEILIEHTTPEESVSGFVIGILWIFGAGIFYRKVFIHGIKKFTAVGS